MFKDFRERTNLYIYDSKEKVLNVMSWLHVLVSLAMIGVLIYYYGFPQTTNSKAELLQLIQYSFGFYIFRYVIKFVYDFNPRDFLKRTWFEATLLFLLLLEGISYNLFGTMLVPNFFEAIGFEGFADVTNVFIQLFFLIYVIMEVFKKRSFRPWFKIHPGLLFTISIATIILIGAGLLMLPEMSVIPGGMSFTD
ncbi:MAG: hypothetical protein ACPGU5_06370, partial [Lishizhenia sp.]